MKFRSVSQSDSPHFRLGFVNYQVQLKFSEKQGLPGSKVGLHLDATANSYCALRAIQSVLLRSGQELSAESVSHIPRPVLFSARNTQFPLVISLLLTVFLFFLWKQTPVVKERSKAIVSFKDRN